MLRPTCSRSRRPARLALALATGALLATSAAHATPDDATALLKRGVDLRREHKDEDALAAFKEAARLAPSAMARAQIALAEQALGRWLDAEKDLDLAMAATGDPWIAKNHGALDDARETIDEHCAWLTVDSNVEHAEITLDDRDLARGKEERVVAGSTILVVQSRGYVPVVRHVDLAPRSHTRLAMILTPLVAIPFATPAATAGAAPAPLPDPDPQRAAAAAPPRLAERPIGDAPTPGAAGPSPVVPLTLVGLGSAAFVVGTYFGVQALNAKTERDDECAGVGGCRPGAAPLLTKIHDSTRVATIAFTVSGVSLAGAAAWWLVSRALWRGGVDRVTITPSVGRGFAGIAIEAGL